MQWFYNLKLTKKLSIPSLISLFFNVCVVGFAYMRMGDASRVDESRLILLVGAGVGIVLSALINYFVVYKVVDRSLFWAIKAIERVADGDLTQNINVKSTEEIGKIFLALKKTIEKMREVASRITDLTHTLADSSQELIRTTEEMNTSAHAQAMQSDQAASAVTEMSQTIADVAINAERALVSARNSSEVASAGFSAVTEVKSEMGKIVATMEESSVLIGKLGASSKQIGGLVEMIEDVADMTNLLALNAAIEAARAGEYGRGFAVVADEVRALAERTTKATKEIASVIKAIQADTAHAVTSMMSSKKQADDGAHRAEEAQASLEKIVEVSDVTVDMVNIIATATEEQSAVSSQVAGNVEKIVTGIHSTETAAEQIQGKSRQLSDLSRELEDAARWFKVA